MERDAGFCSGGSEIGDDYHSDRIQNSPSSTDTSDDSVDIKLRTITLPNNNERKSFNLTYKCENDIPLKKRIKYESVFGNSSNDAGIDLYKSDKLVDNQSNPFRPWIPSKNLHDTHLPNEAEILLRHPAVTTLHRANTDISDTRIQQQQEQPLALIAKKPSSREDKKKSNAENSRKKATTQSKALKTIDEQINDVCYNDDELDAETMEKQSTNETIENQKLKSSLQRNYKNMTRERRIEANARERTRVHTISAAFDTLRQAIPSYSNTQKLSKLSVLRVACAYILTLSRMTGQDYSADESEPSIASCLDEITKTIQTEGKSRKRKDE